MMLTKIGGNTITYAERRLLLLFYSGDISDTVDTLRQALPDIHAPDERAAAEGLIIKLPGMDASVFSDAGLESGWSYVG